MSGSNIMYLVFFANILFFFVPLRLRIPIVASMLLVYAAICGRDSSIVRAVVM
ncbi:MAG: hypothetical protein H6765_05425 [Candidatus Peribacteria bacterium]|nr:MAG: hypothetical protein H6765_05425 [Candidatus Peribacteria bacterium]